jgi:hypothetical protein
MTDDALAIQSVKAKNRSALKRRTISRTMTISSTTTSTILRLRGFDRIQALLLRDVAFAFSTFGKTSGGNEGTHHPSGWT